MKKRTLRSVLQINDNTLLG